LTDKAALFKKAKRYLASARLLLEAADCDSAVSRIYYAAFYVAESLLDASGLSFSSHKGVISHTARSLPKKHVSTRASISC